jgi:hypothetical protein
MKRSLAAVFLPLAMATLSGCLTQIAPPDHSASLGIRWREGYEAARDEALELGRPLLLVMVAGELRDRC